MKVQIKTPERIYTGTCDGLVYYYDPTLDKMLCRRWVKPKSTPQNIYLANTMKNLQKLQPSEEFRNDLRYYLLFAPGKGKRLSWQNLFVTLMHALKREYGVDLRTLSREEIYQHDLPCQSVARAVEAGLLPPVINYQRLNHQI